MLFVIMLKSGNDVMGYAGAINGRVVVEMSPASARKFSNPADAVVFATDPALVRPPGNVSAELVGYDAERNAVFAIPGAVSLEPEAKPC